MQVVMIDSASGRVGAVLSALIAALCIIGLTMHRDFYAHRPRKDFFCFYTNLSNVLVLVYFSLIAPRLYASASLRFLIPAAEFSLMMCIMLTFCVFHVLLFPFVQRQISHMPSTRGLRIVCASSLILHDFVPLLVLAYWILCSPGKASLKPHHALYWTAVPLAYIVFIFIRAKHGYVIEETGTPYPYPFLNADDLGIKQVLYICIRLYGLCLFSGLLIIVLCRVLSVLRGGGYALTLL